MADADLAAMLRGDKTAYGTLMISPSSAFAAAAASTGIDFVFIDTEHVPLDRDELSRMCMLYQALGLPPLVRIPKADAVLARAAIDAGACGIVASYIETVDQARELRRAVKLKPLQGELLELAMDEPERFAREHPRTAALVAERNASTALVLNIESRPAINNLDALLGVPGVDAVLIGPHDLSFNLGVPEDFASDIFQDAVATIFAKARAAGVGAGIHQGLPPTTPGMTPTDAARWIRGGCNVYVHAADASLFATLLKRDVEAIRHDSGEAQADAKRGNLEAPVI